MKKFDINILWDVEFCQYLTYQKSLKLVIFDRVIVRVGDTSVQPVRTVRDLGVYTEADVTMSAHVTAVIKACFAALRQMRSVHRSPTRTTLLTLVHAFVVTKVDYCRSVLSGISGKLLQRLQSVINAAAHLMFSARKLEHITPLLLELH